MTHATLSLSAFGKFAGRSFSKSWSYSESIPDEQLVKPGPEGSSFVLTQQADQLHAGIHVPVFGQIWGMTVNEKGTHTISETRDGITFSGSLTIS